MTEEQSGALEQPKVTIIPPTHVEVVKQDAKTAPGIAERLTQLRKNPSILDRFPQQEPGHKSAFSDLQAKMIDAKSEYTQEEAFYVEHGWKAYLSEYGESNYALSEIVKAEKLDASQIKNAIADGTVKDPNALRLYGQVKLEQTREYWQQTTERFSTHPDLQPELERIRNTAAIAIADVEQECQPLVKGNEKVLLIYARQQAQSSLEMADYLEQGLIVDPTITQPELYTTASHWYEMTARLAQLAIAEKEQKMKQHEQAIQTQEQASKQITDVRNELKEHDNQEPPNAA